MEQSTEGYINISHNDSGEVVISDQNGNHFLTTKDALDVALNILLAIREIEYYGTDKDIR